MRILPKIHPYVILFALVVLVTAPSLKSSFVGDDDDYLIVNSAKIDLSLRQFPLLFTKTLGEPLDHPKPGARFFYYRPMLGLLYALNFKVWGMNPVGFHLTNILLHILSAIFVFRIGSILFCEDKTIPILAAALFAVHPVNNEVLHRVAMNENIYGFFMITSLYFYIRNRKYLSWFTFSLALLSKESAVMLPFALCLFSIRKNGLKKCIVSIMPYAVILMIYFIVRQIIVGTLSGLNVPQPLFPKILTVIAALSDYMRLLIIPYPLSPFYPAKLYTSLLQPKVLGALAAVIVFSLLAFKLRNDKVMLFLLLAPFVLLMPVILMVNAFPLGIDLEYIGERFLYVPSMIFSLFISASALKFANERTKQHVVTALIVVIGLFAGITASSTKAWTSTPAFLDRIAEIAPDTTIAHFHRGNIFFEKRKFTEAIPEFEAAFYPNFSFYRQIADYYIKNSKVDNSTGKIILGHNNPSVPEKLGRYQPNFGNIHFSLGRVYFAQGHIDRAIRKFKVTLILRPDFSYVHYCLGEAYLKQGEFVNARKEFQTFLNSTGRRDK